MTAQNAPAGPAPAKEMPVDLVQTEVQAMPVINPLPKPQTVTPLHRLGNASQWIDCPFCQRRAQVMVRNVGTDMQKLTGVLCCFVCPCFACIPCLAHWFENIEYVCTNCHSTVALRPHDGPMQTF
ncbi:hypothetical protein CP532_3378, partial [Ophiocordyceps camponoti-leonardi (nom. inval.)]